MSITPPNPERTEHAPVMLNEVLEGLCAKAGGSFADLTFGRGGHSRALLEAHPENRVWALDQDPSALEAAEQLRAAFPERFVPVAGNFRDAASLLGGALPFDGVLADLGVSSPQLDNPARGFSFRHEGPLDMRMDPSQPRSLQDFLELSTEKELADAIFKYGEERRSRAIARSIKHALAEGRLTSTAALREAVWSIGGWRRGRIDPATRTFQALRIAVNDEIAALEALLAALPTLVRVGGRVALIAFHSLEDRPVKWALRQQPAWQVETKRPLVANPEECARNPRARSAKLRVATRVSEEQGA